MAATQSTKKTKPSKTKNSLSAKEKEKILLSKIEKAKSDLVRLQHKRKLDIGKLACKHGLDAFADEILEQAFLKLSKELAQS